MSQPTSNGTEAKTYARYDPNLHGNAAIPVLRAYTRSGHKVQYRATVWNDQLYILGRQSFAQMCGYRTGGELLAAVSHRKLQTINVGGHFQHPTVTLSGWVLIEDLEDNHAVAGLIGHLLLAKENVKHKVAEVRARLAQEFGPPAAGGPVSATPQERRPQKAARPQKVAAPPPVSDWFRQQLESQLNDSNNGDQR